MMLYHQNKQPSSSNKFRLYLDQNHFDDRLVLGTWSLGGSHFGSYDTRIAGDVIKQAYERGIRQFDSAEFYAKGQSQVILRNALRSYDAYSYVLHLKAGLRWKGNQVFHDGSAAHLKTVVRDALKFFKRDSMDVFLLHWPDPSLDIRIACDTLSKLKEKGAIHVWGLCNLSKEEVLLVQGYDYSLCQWHYNPLYRHDEKVMNRMQDKQVMVYGYSPFEQGLLVNPRYSQESVLSKRDVRNRNPLFFDTDIKTRLQRLFLLDTAGFSYSHCILQWLFQKSFLDTVIIGPRYLKHLNDSCDVLSFSEADKKRLRYSDFYQALENIF